MADGTDCVRRPPGKKRLLVLDANILIYFTDVIFDLDDDDLRIATQVHEEVDGNKHGEFGFNVRNFANTVERLLLGKTDHEITNGISLREVSCGKATGKIFFQNRVTPEDPSFLFRDYLNKGDNRILLEVVALHKDFPGHDVILVSNDTILGNKARLMGITVMKHRFDEIKKGNQGTKTREPDHQNSHKYAGKDNRQRERHN